MNDSILDVRPAGDRAVLVQLAGLDAVLNLQAQLVDHPFEGQIDVVPASATVLITADSIGHARDIAVQVQHLDLAAAAAHDGALVVIDAVYDGVDLDAVAELTGLDREGVIGRHTGQVWTAAFSGFAPGFAYLVGADRRLDVPRRATPRTSVPAGSVALAGGQSAIYPRQSPGGWQLIGRTTAELWDIDRPQPALIRPGDRVQFRAVRELVTVADATRSTPVEPEPPRPGGVVVTEPGMEATIQDLGRAGWAHLGVTASGALDQGALRRANRLVGNRADLPAVEVLLGGFALEAVTDQVVAVTGASVPVTVAGEHGVRVVLPESPFALLAGESMALGRPVSGLRSYVALRGGIDARSVLGSCSTDTLSGIGPSPLAAGSRLAVGTDRGARLVGSPEIAPAPITQFHVVRGPRDDWFSHDALEQFCEREWLVTPRCNRIGITLHGAPVTRERSGELPSEGTVRGAIQIPPDGLPVVFLSDHPVTGGYPVLGVIASNELDQLAQLAPGSRLRFSWQR